MAATKLTGEQREYLLELLASEYDTRTVRHLLRESGIPDIARETIYGYRRRYDLRISEMRDTRRLQALERGVANKAERIARLTQHADDLERIKWRPDEKGRLWNEKAWRETLQQIAEEKGELTKKHDLTTGGQPLVFTLELDNPNDAGR